MLCTVNAHKMSSSPRLKHYAQYNAGIQLQLNHDFKCTITK